MNDTSSPNLLLQTGLVGESDGPIARLTRVSILGLVGASLGGAALVSWNTMDLAAKRRLESDRSAEAEHKYVELFGLRDDLRYQVVQVQQFLTDVSATRAQNGLDDGFQEADVHAAEFRQDILKALKVARAMNDPRMIQALEQAEGAFPVYYQTGQKMARAYVAGGAPAGNALMGTFDAQAERMDTSLKALDSAFSQFESEMNRAAEAHKQSMTARENFGLGVVGIVGLLNVLGGLTALMLLNRRLLRPLSEAVGALKRLAGGDNTATLSGADKADEMGDLARAVIEFREAALERLRLAQAAEEQRIKIETQRREAELERLHAEETARNNEERRRAESEAERLRSENERRALEDRQRMEMDAERSRNEAILRAASEAQAAVVDGLAGALDRLAKGDLTTEFSAQVPPEYEKLKRDFNGAVRNLKDAITRVAQEVRVIDASATDIDRAASDLAHRTETQAATLEQTAAALDEITATVGKSASGAKSATDVVALARGEADESGAIVTQAIDAMRAIEQSSVQINEIIGVVDEIAFQTNLLALNAGVEAARAGDAGRGFAVVASEVRALAQRSADAAKQIKSLIAASSRQVDVGASLVSKTGASLRNIVERVAGIDEAVKEIAAAAQEQATALREVNLAINQMDRSTQQNAAMVEQTTAASSALSDQAATLKTLVHRFTLDGTSEVRRLRA